MKERRAYPRLDEPALVNYRVLDGPALEARSVSDNISRGGIRFPTDERLRTGSRLKLKINIPFASLSFVGQGVIVWQKELDKKIGKWRYVLGIKFIEMKSSDKKRFVNFLESRLGKQSKKGQRLFSTLDSYCPF